ncbi:MAG: hypothetical protein ACLQVL_34605 [Terriglobia bacterium]
MSLKPRQVLTLAALACSLVLVPRERISGEETKRCSDLFNPEALHHIRSVCVDTTFLEPAVASDVKSYIEKEGQPGHLLTALPWRVNETCAPDDAVVRVYFAEGEHRSTTYMAGSRLSGPTSVDTFEPETRVVLLVYDRASVRLLYRTESVRRWSKRAALLKVSFSMLVKDVSAVRR